MKVERFKVGDRVRVLPKEQHRDKGGYDAKPHWNGGMESTIGQLGTVTDVDSHDLVVRVVFGNDAAWWYRHGWLEMDESQARQEFFQALQSFNNAGVSR